MNGTKKAIVFAAVLLCLGDIAQAEHVHSEPAESFFENFFKIYTPRKVCMFHEAPVIWLHVVSDALIALAYYSIPAALIYFARRRKDMAFSWVLWLFAAFILACGTTHAIGVLDVWLPFYKVDGAAKFVTAIASVATAAALWPLIPKALAMASPAQLEQTVRERTAELSRANAALRDSEEQLSAFFENTAVGASQLDVQGQFLRVNRRYCEISGYKREELIGRSVLDLSPPEDRPRDENHLHRFMSGESVVYDIERRYVRKDGSIIWVHTAAGLLRDHAGRPWCSCAITQEITERKRAEEALRTSEQRFRELADSMPQIVWASRPDGVIDYYNRRWYESTGNEEGVVGDESWLPVMHPDDRQRCLDLWYHCVRTGEDYQIEYRFKFPAFEDYRWHLGRALPVRNEEGKIMRWYGTCTDIHELRSVQDALKESDERFRLALNASNCGWWHLDLATNALEADGQVKTLLDLPAEAALSLRSLTEQSSEQDRPKLERQLRDLRESSGDYEVEFRTKSEDSNGRWVLMRGRSFDHGAVKPTRAMGIAIDISERKHLEEQLQAATTSALRAKEAAERANSAKDQFLAVLSHELRTPLAPVLGAVTLIERMHASEKIQEPLEIIRRNVQLEARLIDDLLDLTRIVRGKIILDRQAIDIRNVLERVVEVCAPDIEARGVHLGPEICDSPLIVKADISRLQQIFWNLLKNAIKFTPEGGCIGLVCRRERSSAVIEVIDSGIGIELDALPRIFDAFEQANEKITRQFGGLGLGLAITKKLVEMHDGRIRVESAGPGRGATFRVALPLSIEEQPTATVKPIVHSRPTKLKRILLVEDHGDTARTMRALLEGQGYKVECAGDAAHALSLIETRSFDLLISDLGLPDRSGIELMQEIRRRGSDLRGIALSGFGREEDLARSKEAGFVEHLTKPIDFGALTAAIERLAGA